MKISIVGPGIMPIPPTGWGAVEILIWDQKLALEKLGYEVDIVNTKSPIEIIQKIVGPILVKPFVDFKKPLEVIPRMIAKRRNMYPDKFVINLSCFTK